MIESRQKKNGHYYFVVKARNGQILVTSEDYESESARDYGIVTLKNIIKDLL